MESNNRPIVASLMNLLKDLPLLLNKPIRMSKRGKNGQKIRRRVAPKAGSATGLKAPQFTLEGIVEIGNTTRFSISGEDFDIGPDTWIFGEIEPGAHATVKGTVSPGIGKFATNIVVNQVSEARI